MIAERSGRRLIGFEVDNPDDYTVTIFPSVSVPGRKDQLPEKEGPTSALFLFRLMKRCLVLASRACDRPSYFLFFFFSGPQRRLRSGLVEIRKLPCSRQSHQARRCLGVAHDSKHVQGQITQALLREDFSFSPNAIPCLLCPSCK